MITVGDAMTTRLHTCNTTETLDRAAKVMWEHGCSEVPVVDDDGFFVTMVSERGALLCAYTQGKALTEIPVSCAATGRQRVLRTGDSLDRAHELMRKDLVRSMAVVERTGRLIGVLSITDIIRTEKTQSEPRLSASSVAELPRQSTGLRAGPPEESHER
jgi:CBS domain-containing protein